MDKKKIKYIDIQPFNYCNLSCWFCPPHNLYKEHNYKELNDITLKNFINLINYLKNNNLIEENVKICCNRYCEPFYNIEKIIKIYEEIKKTLPNCYFEITTNSLLINKKKIDLIKKYNINIIINFYDKKNLKEILFFLKENFDKVNNFKKFTYFNLKISIINDKKKILIEQNLLKDRGGILKLNNNIRNTNCNIKNNILAIDYDGYISPCCDLYKKNKEHKSEYYLNLNNLKIENFLEDFYEQNKKINFNFCKNCIADLNNLTFKN